MAVTTIAANNAHLAYIERARAAGLPRDQIENFILAGYTAFPEMLPFHDACREADRSDGPDLVALGGTRGPGKSHAALAQAGLDDCQRQPGLKVLFLRKIQKAASESFEDLIYKVFAYIPHDYKSSKGRIDFPNGSRILLGGFKAESDIDKYLGVEYDLIIVEEATQLSQSKIEKIQGSLRTTKPGWKARMYATTNPDGIGLKWFKAWIYEPSKKGPDAEQANHTRFIFCHWKNNPLLKEEYHRFLNKLSGALRKAWRDGDFQAFEGMAFSQWNEEIHVVDPFEIPDHWMKWRATDDGYTNPWCTLWFARDPDTRRIYVYREAYETQLTSTRQAQMILDMTPPNEIIKLHYADPSMWAAKNAQGKISTPADDYKSMGILLTKAENVRIIGKRRVDEMLGLLPDGLPGIQVFRHCYNLVRTLPELPSDPNNPEDVDTRAEDHPYDTLRYGLTGKKIAQAPRPTQQQPERRNPLATIKYL